VTLDASGSTDPNGDIASILWEQTAGAAVTLSDETVEQPTFTAPDVDPAGQSLTFRVTVTDSTGAQDSDTCIVDVAWVNLAPTAHAGGDQTVDEGTVAQLDSSASSDADDGIASYQWRQTAGLPVTLSNPTALQPTFTTPNVGPAGASLTFELTVTDNGGLSDTDLSVVDVAWVNLAPIANAGPDQNVQAGVDVTLDGTNSSDADDGLAAFQWVQTGGSAVTLSDPAAQQPTFIAPGVGAGGASFTFSLTVTDQYGLQDTDTCVVNVILDNFPPTADAGADQVVDEGDPVVLDGSNSSDPDGIDDIVSYLWTQSDGPAVTLSDATAVQPTFTAPDVGIGGVSLTFQLTVSDSGGLQHTDTSIVNVSWVNIPPTANAGTDQTVDEAALVTLDGLNSSDFDDGIASYLWHQLSGPSVTLSNPTAVKPTFTAPVVGSGGGALTFQLTVTDANGLQDTDTCIVNISWNNLAPTADAGSAQSVNQGDTVTLDGSLSDDPEGEIAAYLWKQIAGPAVTLSDPAAVQPTFTAPSVGLAGGSLTFQLTVTDSGGLEATDTCNVNVTWQNQPPTADAGVDQTATEGTTVTLDGSASNDPDDGVASYLWAQTGNGTSVTLSDPASATATFMAPPVGAGGATLVLELTVTDVGGLQSSQTVNVHVVDNGITGFPDEALTLNTSDGYPVGVTIANGGSITKLDPIDPSTLPSSSAKPQDMTYGLFDIHAKPQLPGEQVTITVYLPEPAPADYSWYKFNQVTNQWVNYSSMRDTAGIRGATFNEARDQITLILVDGGMGDDDGQANGTIEDPSGLGLVPAFSIGSNAFGGGSSCFIGACGDYASFPHSIAVISALLSLAVLFSFPAIGFFIKRKRC
jgi:phage tail protein X